MRELFEICFFFNNKSHLTRMSENMKAVLTELQDSKYIRKLPQACLDIHYHICFEEEGFKEEAAFRSLKKKIPETINAQKEFIQLYDSYNKQENELNERFKQLKRELAEKRAKLDKTMSTLFLNQINNIPSQMLLASEKLYLNNLCSLRGQKTTKWEMIFRASKDGFRAKQFHAKCDGFARTLTVIKTIDGFIFGGYTEQAWHSNNSYVADENSFLFSLVNSQLTPIKLRCVMPECALYSHEKYGPTFGRGYDIHVADNSNSNCNSFSTLISFTNPKHEGSSTLLGGTEYFMISDFEIFQRVH